MPLRDIKYKQNQTILSTLGYGDNMQIRLVTLNCLRTSGIEDEDKEFTPKGEVNEEKLSNNISRTKRKIFELAYCNPWEYFATLTINPDKFDRTDLKQFQRKNAQWLRDLNKKYKKDIKYLLVPELHKDQNSWHLHGFFNGLPLSLLHQFQIGDTMGKQIAEKVKRGEVVYNWEGYQKKFGFCSLEPIRSHEAVSKYITKYITKDLLKSVTELNSHMYFSSQNLNTAMKIKKGTLLTDIQYDFENDYCSIKTFPYSEELLNELHEAIDSEYF